MRFGTKCAGLLPILCLLLTNTVHSAKSVPASVAASAASPSIPATAKNPEGFKIKGWNIASAARGDLDLDNKEDCAVIVYDEASGQCKLIVALRKSDGLFHKICENESAITVDCGTATKVSIKKHVLDLHHYCGHRNLLDTDYKYQLKDDRLLLIGYTNNLQDATTLQTNSKVDLNLLTGELEGQQRQGTELHKERFLEVRSPLISETEPQVTDWTAPAAWLNAKSSTCPVISVQSVHSANTLFVRVQLESADKISSKEMRLVDGKGDTIAPLSMKGTTYGYVLASYDLRSGVLADVLNDAKRLSGDADPLLRLSVQVTPSGCSKTFSTGNKEAGGILLSHAAGLPSLDDVEVRNGELLHPFLWLVQTQ